MNFTPLYIKTDNSFFQSLIKIPDLIDFALKNNLKSLTLTDNNLYGSMDFYMLSIKNNIKPIIGLELNINNQKIVLYCTNFNGYQNLLKINTIMSEREITLNDLILYNSNIICLVPFDYYDLYKELSQIFSLIFRTYKTIEEKNMINEESLYMNETLCLNKEDLEYLTYLNKIGNKDKKQYTNNYLHLEEDLTMYDDKLNYKLYDLCNLEIPLNQNLMPKFVNSLNISSYEYLKKLCIDGLKKKFGNEVAKKYQDRLKHELNIINKMNFCDYFLIVADYVKYAKDSNILVGPGRGSAVSSLVAYLLDITEVDPVLNDLLFERFLNEDRVSMPDIDIDFEHIRREDVIEYCINKYGQMNVTPIISFGTMGARQTIREIGNILNIDNYILDNLSKQLDSNLDLKSNLLNKDIKNYIDNNNLQKLIKIALKLEGLKHHTSLHAAGIVMSKNSLDEIIPIVYSNNKYISGIDMTYLEKLGLLKMDFLAIKYLTIIHEMIDSINKKYNLNIKFSEIPLDDKKTYEIFKNGNTLGIFQFESDGMINFLKKLKPDTFADISLAMALYRPGPMKNIDKYILNKNNKENIKYIDDSLIDILKPTYGILIYQEQIMQTASLLANYTKGEADLLRKAMSKKDKKLLLSFEQKFKDGCVKNNISIQSATKIYDAMLNFAEYGFNKSHSYGYSLVSYRMAYLKANYPYVFMSKILSLEINDKVKLKKYLNEAKRNNLNVLNPSINVSTDNFEEFDNSLVYPLSGIKDIPITLINNIIVERKNGKYKDIYDFIKRINNKLLTSNVLENLIKSSCFREFNINNKTLVENIDLITNYGELLNDIDDAYALKPILKEYEDYTLKEKLHIEKELFGIYLSNHPTMEYKAKYNNIVDIIDIAKYFDTNINVLVYIDNKKEIMTKKNDKMCFLNVSDETESIDLTLFPKVYKENININDGNVILVNGKVEKRYEKYQIVVNKIKILD